MEMGHKRMIRFSDSDSGSSVEYNNYFAINRRFEKDYENIFHQMYYGSYYEIIESVPRIPNSEAKNKRNGFRPPAFPPLLMTFNRFGRWRVEHNSFIVTILVSPAITLFVYIIYRIHTHSAHTIYIITAIFGLGAINLLYTHTYIYI